MSLRSNQLGLKDEAPYREFWNTISINRCVLSTSSKLQEEM